MNVDWDAAAKKLFRMIPEGCNSLTATAELDDGYSQIGFVCTRQGGHRETIFLEPIQVSESSSSLLKIRHELSEQSGDKIDGCEIVVSSDGTFKYHLSHSNR